MPLPDERILEIIAEVEAAQVLQRLSVCACCGEPLGFATAVPTECEECKENFR